MFFARGVMLLLALVLLTGCDSNAGRMRVGGNASYGGEPIEKGILELLPIDATTGPATGGIIQNGRWEIASEKGPLIGNTYLVRITGVRKTGRKIVDRDFPDMVSDQVANFIPAKYNAESTLKITVSENPSENEIDFDLASVPSDTSK